MNVHRKGWNDLIKLRLKLSRETTEVLQQMLLRRDPANTRRFLFDKKTRDAAYVVLRVRLQRDAK